MHFTNEWLYQMETTFQVHVAVNQIENMIKGRYTAFGWKESVYEIARESGLCSEELYQFNLELLIEGTTLRVIYLEMKGVVSVLPSLMQELKERIFLNERMYDRYCRKFLMVISVKLMRMLGLKLTRF